MSVLWCTLGGDRILFFHLRFCKPPRFIRIGRNNGTSHHLISQFHIVHRHCTESKLHVVVQQVLPNKRKTELTEFGLPMGKHFSDLRFGDISNCCEHQIKLYHHKIPKNVLVRFNYPFEIYEVVWHKICAAARCTHNIIMMRWHDDVGDVVHIVKSFGWSCTHDDDDDDTVVAVAWAWDT